MPTHMSVLQIGWHERGNNPVLCCTRPRQRSDDPMWRARYKRDDKQGGQADSASQAGTPGWFDHVTAVVQTGYFLVLQVRVRG